MQNTRCIRNLQELPDGKHSAYTDGVIWVIRIAFLNLSQSNVAGARQIVTDRWRGRNGIPLPPRNFDGISLVANEDLSPYHGALPADGAIEDWDPGHGSNSRRSRARPPPAAPAQARHTPAADSTRPRCAPHKLRARSRSLNLTQRTHLATRRKRLIRELAGFRCLFARWRRRLRTGGRLNFMNSSENKALADVTRNELLFSILTRITDRTDHVVTLATKDRNARLYEKCEVSETRTHRPKAGLVTKNDKNRDSDRVSSKGGSEIGVNIEKEIETEKEKGAHDRDQTKQRCLLGSSKAKMELHKQTS
ncbi:hypothetical protein EVAR_10699_1 [Eumeta japonica]|uniref:Uncharacterized protein n=1 Tax=Eumeta variegata TaxID=151549 RepID=A0A4C1U797_EUMVA|nr:hypothetical protein EVAR_10699_1 [Eumeta japonica]